MTEKQPKSKEKVKQNREPSNIVQEEKKKKGSRERKKETAEDRAKRELDKIAAYQARLAKKSNKQRKIRTIVEDNRYESKAGIYQ